MLTPAEAEKAILAHMAPFLREDCPLEAAHGRIHRADVRADRDLPPFDRVTMDGFALRTAALAAGGRTFRVEGTQAAGMRALKLSPADHACIEVMTGAVLPEGADAVVPFEQTTRAGDAVTLAPGVAPTAGFSIHRRGSDHLAGDVVLPAGRRISGREIAVAASVGASTLTVAAQPKIAVIVTGDELVEVEGDVAPHQIRRSNDHALRAALIAAGFPRVERFHFRDLPSEIEHRLWHILAEYDCVLLTGGVSKGKFDFLPAALAAQGVRKVFHGVAQRPGKPFWFGVTSHHKPVFALPGNPVSAYTCLHRYVLPALAHASGLTPPAPRLVSLAAPVDFAPPLALLLPVRLSGEPRAELLATPDPSNTSGDFTGLINTDGFIELPADRATFPAGTLAPYFAWV